MVSSPTIFWRCLSLLFWASYVLSRHQTVLNPSQDQSCLGSDTDSKAFSRIMENNDSQDRSICEGTSCELLEDGVDAVPPSEGN